MLLLVALFACAPVSPPPEPVADPAPPPAEPVPPAAPALPAEDTTPAGLYAACRDRMEQPEADGECTTDADCAPTGCGGEVCAKAGTTGLMWTCEERPCFRMVSTCGCQAGRCTWSLAEAGALPPPKLIKKGPAAP